MTLEKVISGGQTGADRAALVAAKAAGIATGGWMPKGFLARDGRHPSFAAEYGIREHTSPRYPPRTARNVAEADATLRFATDWDSPGERLTLDVCRKLRKPYFDVTPGGGQTAAAVAEWLRANDVRVLNVAGNREDTSPGIGAFVAGFLADVFAQLRKRHGRMKTPPARQAARELAAGLRTAVAGVLPRDEPGRATAALNWLTSRLNGADREPVLLTYGAAWDVIRPHQSRVNRGAGAYAPMLRAAAGIDRLIVSDLGLVALDTFIVNASRREPGNGHWDDVDYTRTTWRRVFAGAVVLQPADLT